MSIIAAGAALTAGQKIGRFFKRNWLFFAIVIAVLLGFAASYVYGKSVGAVEADGKWITAYGESVKEFNENARKVAASSTAAGDRVVKAEEKAGDKLENIIGQVHEAAAGQKSSGSFVCVQADLNTKLDPAFMKAWNQMNDTTAGVE